MFKNIGVITSVCAAAFLSVNVANANDWNTKELNGRSSYLGAARIVSSNMGDIGFTNGPNKNSSNVASSKKISFDDPDGWLATVGNDYGYVRLETEFGYRDTDVATLTGKAGTTYAQASGAVDIGTAMMNLAFEYSIDPGELSGGESSGFSITPFVTVGGGALGALGNLNFLTTNVSSPIGENAKIDGVDNGMFIAPAIQGGAGLTVGLPYGVEIFGNYSEMLAYTYNYKSSNDIHIKTVSGGLRFNF